jgi:CRP-like cAMP-binding protein
VVLEVATTGYEGMVGLPLFLGATSSPLAAFCQVPGRSARLSAPELRKALDSSGSLHSGLSRFTQAHLVQIAQNVVCNGSHPVQQRAARWLLTTHDRVGRDEFSLTQQYLALMLGARRPTVSATARMLQADGLIQYRRGVMTITDRPRLESRACSCYAIVKAEFDALTRHP